MLISQPALMCLTAVLHRVMGKDDAGFLAEAAVPEGRALMRELLEAPVPSVEVSAEPLHAAAKATDERKIVRDTERLDATNAPLTANERRARAAALRALALSRGRRFESARLAFIEASRLDPELDLTRTPTFWSLERSAHEAAIDAYKATGREGDAAVLQARVRSTYRPKAVRARVEAPAAP